MIDKGSFGFVFKAIDRDTNEVFALKRIPKYASVTKNPRSYARKICREVAILSLLSDARCEYVVPLNRVYLSEDKEDVFIQMPYIEYNLFHIVENRAMVEREIKYIAWQLLAGIKQCHDRHFMHRDLTLKNILLDQWLAVFIADFGLARAKDTAEEEGTIDVVTMEYRPPELLLTFQQYDARIDIWSLGCIVAEMFLRRRAFTPDHRDPLHQNRKIMQLLSIAPDPAFVARCAGPKAGPTVCPAVENSVQELRSSGYLRAPPYEEFSQQLAEAGAGPEAIGLIRHMLQYDYTNRATAQEALNHPWFTNDPEYAEEDQEEEGGQEQQQQRHVDDDDGNNNNNDDNSNNNSAMMMMMGVGDDGACDNQNQYPRNHSKNSNSANGSSMGSRQNSHLAHNTFKEDDDNCYALSKMKIVHSDYAEEENSHCNSQQQQQMYSGYGENEGISKKQNNNNNNHINNNNNPIRSYDGNDDVALISKQSTSNSSLFGGNNFVSVSNSTQAVDRNAILGDDGAATAVGATNSSSSASPPTVTATANATATRVTLPSWHHTLDDIDVIRSVTNNADAAAGSNNNSNNNNDDGSTPAISDPTINESNDILYRIQKANLKQMKRFMDGVVEYHNELIRQAGKFEQLQMINGDYSNNPSETSRGSESTSSPNSNNHDRGGAGDMVLQNSQCGDEQ